MKTKGDEATFEMIVKEYDISPGGKRLLEVLTEPENRMKSVTEQCQIAEISRDSYYRLFRLDNFVEAYYESCKLACLSAALPVMHTVAEKAKKGDMAAAAMVLEMSGLHKKTVEHTHKVEAGKSLLELYRERQGRENAVAASPAVDVEFEVKE